MAILAVAEKKMEDVKKGLRKSPRFSNGLIILLITLIFLYLLSFMTSKERLIISVSGDR